MQNNTRINQTLVMVVENVSLLNGIFEYFESEKLILLIVINPLFLNDFHFVFVWKIKTTHT